MPSAASGDVCLFGMRSHVGCSVAIVGLRPSCHTDSIDSVVLRFFGVRNPVGRLHPRSFSRTSASRMIQHIGLRFIVWLASMPIAHPQGWVSWMLALLKKVTSSLR